MKLLTKSCPQRLLMTADTVGGVWTYALDLARELGKHNVQIVLATMGALPGRTQRAELRDLPNVELCASAFKLEWMPDPWDDVERAGEWLLELEDRFQPDLVHLNGYCHGALPWRAPRIVAGHSCVLSWWRAVKGCDAPPEWQDYQDAVIEGLQLANLVVAPSGAMLAALEQHYGPFAESRVVPNGRCLNAAARRTKHDFILSAGRLWDEAKNISTLASVGSRLPWPVYVAGDDIEPGKLNGQSHFGDSSAVNFLGRLPSRELVSWFERAAIYCLPARYEPFGLSALEAAQAGCALVLGDIPSLREIWGDAAMFVSPDDPAELESALQDLIASPARRARLADTARCVAGQYTPEKMARGYLAVYADAMARHAEQTCGVEKETSNIQRSTSNIERNADRGTAANSAAGRNSFDIFNRGAACVS